MKHPYFVRVLGSSIGLILALLFVGAIGSASANQLAQSAAGIPAARTDVNAPESVPVSSTFTYQGRLANNGTPVTGTCSLAFRLFDDPSAGNLVGNPITLTAVSVVDGYFTVGLNFGSSAFTGNARWLALSVNCGSGFTPLAPRQAVTAAPYALYAPNAPWSGLAGVPAGFADGVDDNTTYSAGAGLNLIGTQFSVNTTTIQSRVSGTCASGNAIRVVNANGTVTCEPTGGGGTYTSGFGLNLIGNSFSVNTTTIQARVGSTCAGGSAIRVINPNGTVTCEPISSSPSFWKVDGNSGTTAGFNFLGTRDAQDFVIATNLTERMRISSSGNVGIGTNSPLTKLHVKGNTANSGNNTAVFEDTTIGPNASAIHYGTTGDWYIRSASSGGKVIIQDTGGNVGIGTSSPQRTLHVSGANTGLRLQSTDSHYWTTTEYQTDAWTWHTGVGGSMVTNGVANDYYIADAIAGAFRLIIDTFGNVTIGATSQSIKDSYCGSRLFVFKGVFAGSAPFACGGAVTGESDFDTGVTGVSQMGVGVSAGSDDAPGLWAWSGNSTAVRADDNSGTYIFEGWDTQSVSNRRFAVERATGNVLADGAYTGPADFAEMLPVSRSKEDYAPGDVMVIGTDGKLIRSNKPNATNLAGVYSAQPGFVGDTEIAAHGIESHDSPLKQDRIAVALIGIVPVKVTDENGAIHPGDLLTTSSMPGHAMKAKAVMISGVEIYPTGTILGKALESWNKGSGVIQVLVTLR